MAPPVVRLEPCTHSCTLALHSFVRLNEACSKLEHVMNTMDRRRIMHYNASKANSLVNGHTTGTGLVNGAFVCKACLVASSGTSDSTPAGTVNDAKPHSMVNGAMPPVSRVKRTVPSKTLRKRGGTISGAPHASTPGVVSAAGIPVGVSVKGTTSPDTVGSPSSSNKTAPEQTGCNPSAPTQIRRPRSKFWRKKRSKAVAPPLCPVATSMPPHEEEDWEKEIQEARLADWAQMSFGTNPYDPEEVLSFAFGDLTLHPVDTPGLPVTACYLPDEHHPGPVQWSCHIPPPEPDQFADAEE